MSTLEKDTRGCKELSALRLKNLPIDLKYERIEEMYTNEYKTEDTTRIPIYNIRMMTDEEWNRLAYRNFLERQAIANGRTQKIQ